MHLIDFGADTTTISVYKNNILRFLTVLPLGGNSITRDITTLQMEEEEAERLKKAYGDALYEEDPEQEEEATCKLDDDNRIIKVADLNNIIEARAEGNRCQRMEPDTTIELRGQIAGRNHLDRRGRQPEESGRNLAQTQQDRKDTDGETPTQYGSCAQQHTEERRFAEHFVRAPV